MKLKIAVLAVTLLLTACGTTKKSDGIDGGQITAINTQKLTSNFKRKGIKLEYDCAFGTGLFEATCVRGDIKGVEVTAYAPSYGNSEVNREVAFKVAEDQAKAKLIRFLKEDINTTAVTRTISKNIEKANDRIKQRIKNDQDVEMSDEDAAKDTNYAIRENTNETTRVLTETIRAQANGILRGIQVVDEDIVDRQTVKVTIRWDRDSGNAAKSLRRQIGN